MHNHGEILVRLEPIRNSESTDTLDRYSGVFSVHSLSMAHPHVEERPTAPACGLLSKLQFFPLFVSFSTYSARVIADGTNLSSAKKVQILRR